MVLALSERSCFTTDAQRAEVEAYVAATAKRTEREASATWVSGVFSGYYAVEPLHGC